MRQFEAGQCWTFKNAPLAESRVVIGKVDEIAGKGCHVSICVTDVFLPDAATHAMRRNAISHAPITPEALDGSVIDQTGTGELVEGFDDAYSAWRDDLDAGTAGSFIIPVDQIVLFIGEALVKGHDVPDPVTPPSRE